MSILTLNKRHSKLKGRCFKSPTFHIAKPLYSCKKIS